MTCTCDCHHWREMDIVLETDNEIAWRRLRSAPDWPPKTVRHPGPHGAFQVVVPARVSASLDFGQVCDWFRNRLGGLKPPLTRHDFFVKSWRDNRDETHAGEHDEVLEVALPVPRPLAR